MRPMRPMRLFPSLALLAAILLAGAPPLPALETVPVMRTLQHQGLKRTYTLISPLQARDAHGHAPRRPALIMLHGGGGTGINFKHLTYGGFEKLADRENVVVAYPEGYKRQWNDGRNVANIPAQQKRIDDVGFIARLIDELIAKENVDPRRVYVGGISNGGMMSNRLACELSPRIAAIAVVAAAMPKNLVSPCKPSSPVSVVMMNGTRDPLVPYEGGEVEVSRPLAKGQKRGEVLSAAGTARFWAGKNGFPAESNPTVSYLPDANPGDYLRIRRTDYKAASGADVVLYTIEGGGHTWPGGLQYAPDYMVGQTTQELNAVETMWAFFKAHPKITPRKKPTAPQ